MPQFDILTLSPQILGLLACLSLLYFYNVTNVMPHYAQIKKYRTKKLLKNGEKVRGSDESMNNNLWLLNNSYKSFLN